MYVLFPEYQIALLTMRQTIVLFSCQVLEKPPFLEWLEVLGRGPSRCTLKCYTEGPLCLIRESKCLGNNAT